MFNILNAEPLRTDEAFKIDASVSSNGVIFDFNVNENVYIYSDKFSILLGQEDITELLNLPKKKEYKSNQVYVSKFQILVPFGLISSSANLDKFNININYTGCSLDGFCYSPQNLVYSFTKFLNSYQISKINNSKNTSSNYQPSSVKKGSLNQDEIAINIENKGFILTLITFFGYGLLLSLTPCVFPMIPILSSIIVAKCGQDANIKKSFFISFIYVFAMSLTYAIAGILASFLGANLQSFLQIPTVLIGFALVFVILAFSMFGFYQIQLPAFLQNKINKKSENHSGLLGVFIMGFLSALIVGPCVAAPLAGALLYISKTGDLLLGGLSLFIMSFGMGVPLLIVGLGAGKFMPKPGFWMNQISKIFGFIMLFMAVWIASRVIGDNLSLLFYGILGIIFAVFMLPNSFKESDFWRIKLSFSLIVFIYSLILIIGFTNGSTSLTKPLLSEISHPKSSLNFTKISTIKELDDFIKNAKKPVIVDFWASWCVNCKELDKILKDPNLQDILSHFELVKIDVTKNSDDDLELMSKFNVYGPPSLVFFKDQKELKDEQIISVKNVDELKNKLENILNKI
ncbi:protein-disulfide reductase DsbD [Campylobacter sp. FMV-PI01]|uniref:Protein-disulfide reductase DsbD n=2 Tax=Campylobacter portucalensis TaxID=2608384 RepID=A0A6L5WI70_9BACT|nr:protein-disulfide reductase DsbD [Campylobacter portucalensis]